MATRTMAAQETAEVDSTGVEKKKDVNESIVSFDFGVDPYYTSAGIIFHLTREEIPTVTDSRETRLYTDLIQGSFMPRFILFEGSVNPMPVAGVATRYYAPDIYQKANIDPSFNLVKTITAGFEEPYAASIFFGNLVKFKNPDEKSTASNMGYLGYLFSFGNYHIKDNRLIDDLWVEFEWKIKGERSFEHSRHNWSFRLGGKFHSNPEIADVFYLSIRRNRIDFLASIWSVWENSGLEYTFDFAADELAWVRHFFLLEKKFPVRQPYALSLAIGFNYEANRKYTGSLADRVQAENFQFLIRPNIQF